MKEANPVNLRFGVSRLSKYNTTSVLNFFDSSLRLELFFFKATLLVLESAMYYTILNPIMVFTHSGIVVYFYFYPTQFTNRRLRVRRRRRRLGRYSVRYKRLKLLNGNKSPAIRRVLDVKTLINFVEYRSLRRHKRRIAYTFNNRICKRSPHVGVIKQSYLYNVKKKLEYLFFKATGSQSRCFFRTIFSTLIAKHTTHIRYKSYLIYKRFFYYQRSDNFVDCINIILFTIRYHIANFIVSFICRELERTPYHNRFIRMMKQILAEFYNNTKIFTGFKLSIRGPVNKHARTKRLHYIFGGVSIQTFKISIDYFNFFSITKFGALGIRLWVH